MLSCLRIKNFALIDQLELEFSRGLTVLTGETGAGKSIILDAIDIALGGKANNRLIRQGAQQAIVEATFRVNADVRAWLQELEIDLLEDESVVCSRELTVVGDSLRSRSRINGILANRQLMAKLRDRLVEITAQGQTVQLMDSSMQRELLDLYGGTPLWQQREIVASTYNIAQAARSALEKRRQSEQQRLQRLDLLNYQVKELESANLSDPQELEQLEQERDRLAHVVDLQQLSYQANQILYQSDSEQPAVADLLGQAESILMDMTKYDEGIEPILEIIRMALNEVIEAGHQINTYGDGLEADPERLAEVEERILFLKRLCRKYGASLAEVISYYQQLQQELAELTDSDRSVEKLEAEDRIARENLNQACQELTKLRQQVATKLEKQLTEELKPLAMDKVVFVCQIDPCPPTATGSDRVVFYFSPNAGEKIQPLASTASGGEMSRFLLALKACFSDSEKQSGTLIFDEIDAGVSGKVAQAIAEKLHHLSQKHQVLCVTHQPLVAAMADSHFRVDKQIIEEFPSDIQDNNGQSHLPEIRTVVRVSSLENLQMRREELAQLTGGHSAEDAIAFAESLLAKAQAAKGLSVGESHAEAQRRRGRRKR
ncbi:MAG: DNA repair protein RecN [Hydrococcus sp. C42_A2020_068]|uniref:DNA repair protein RecN n=1 Tax=Pleurocapsa sp. PCC 7327 TaxID=118163 RepID=UPI00029FC110|nr:DNA repair protein RecN [Pleurocapsa sp. PCC 7327]AFY76016.1 DNA repair protein RecN [Pleurocapsa sp. PCC 7327]MBF2021882.1 DNA repair protein RecN [Hydrococcus sp. C42_A2020_068]